MSSPLNHRGRFHRLAFGFRAKLYGAFELSPWRCLSFNKDIRLSSNQYFTGINLAIFNCGCLLKKTVLFSTFFSGHYWIMKAQVV